MSSPAAPDFSASDLRKDLSEIMSALKVNGEQVDLLHSCMDGIERYMPRLETHLGLIR